MGSHNGGPFFFVPFGLLKKTKLFIIIKENNLTITDYINKNYNRLFSAAKNITKGHPLTDDLFQHCIEVLLNDKNDEKIQRMVDNDTLNFYFVSVLIRNYNSSTSRFHYIYRKGNDLRADRDVYDMQVPDEEYDASKELKISYIEGEIQKLEWYSKRMLELYYYEGYSFQQISDLTGIPKTSVWNTVTNAIKQIKTK